MRRVHLAWTIGILAAVASCAGSRPFALREPLRVDTDLLPVSVACRPDPSPKEPQRQNCAPAEYVSPYVWDQIDKAVFEPLSRVLSLEDWGEAANANSMDEVADSSWFTNRVGSAAVTRERMTTGECTPEDILPTTDQVPDAGWLINHGKDNGATLGFRIDVPGKGLYLLKADDLGRPERASAASAIGAAIYHTLGFNSTCEQVVVIRKAQLKLQPGLTYIDNLQVAHPIDDAWLDKVLQQSTQVPGGKVRFQASKWLPGLPIGPFKYAGTRKDDPNDVIEHQHRRELRGSKLLAAWLNHWDAREQNSMDVWFAQDEKHKASSPGLVKHYILDTSDVFGGDSAGPEVTKRLGASYALDLGAILIDLVTLGIIERPWDHAKIVKGHEKFYYFDGDEFDGENWKPLYPNPAFRRMTERDGAWMARQIARIGPDDLRALLSAGQFSDPSDVAYLFDRLRARQLLLLTRYLMRLSPLGDVHATADGSICATDFARAAEVVPAERVHYTVVMQRGDSRLALTATTGAGGQVCFQPPHSAPSGLADSDPRRIAIFELRNGTAAGPLEIHTYDLDVRGVRIVGLERPEP